MLTQLNPPIPLYLPEKGAGQAIAVIDYGPEHHLIWVTALDASGEIWCAPNPQVRLQGNWTMRRESSAPKKGGLRAVMPDKGEREDALLAEGKPC